MLKSGKSFSVPTWLKGFGWLAFGILALATLLVAARWLVMENGHRETQRRVALVKKNKPSPQPSTSSASDHPAPENPGIPLSALRHFGPAFSGDKEASAEFDRQIQKIHDFYQSANTHPEHLNGRRSFRATLRLMGIAMPDAMTEEEAAREFLKQADHFSTFLAHWREAVAKGPLAEEHTSRFYMASCLVSDLLSIMLEARLRCDPAGAWDDWLALRNTRARCVETYPFGNYRGDSEERQIYYLARMGMDNGSWSGDQMAEISSMVAQRNAVDDMRERVERIKESITSYYANFDGHRENFEKRYLNTPSQFNKVVNQVKLKLITDQQIRDNMALELADAERVNSHFDPETGYYIPPSDAETNPSSAISKSDSFFFMIRDFRHGDEWVDRSTHEHAQYVIRSQSENDQFRLALALETYRQKNGSYPDHLESVSAQFPGGPPMDIATGQPYFYQKDPDGYTLWSTGIDGRNDGGDVRNDVTWRHRPVKTK